MNKNTNNNENRRVPGFTAERGLEQKTSTPFGGRVLRSAEGLGVEPAYIICYSFCFPDGCDHYCFHH